MFLKNAIVLSTGGVYAVRECNSSLGGRYELQGSPAVRVHGPQAGRLLGEAQALRERGLASKFGVKFFSDQKKFGKTANLIPDLCAPGLIV